MNIFTDNQFKTFEQLASLTQESLKRFLTKYLKVHYKKVVSTKDYIYAVGDIPVALCSHMDTVFKTPPKEVFYDTRRNVCWSPDGLGADDRAGVFAILSIIGSGLRPSVIFTTDEEKGCLGAEKLSRIDCPFDDIRYIIELDRRGTCDCIFYDCENIQFTEYVESFGFIENWGSYSDICEFCPTWEVAGVNLSVGYRDEHSVSEVLFVEPLLATIKKVKDMLQEDPDDIPFFKYIPAKYGYSYWSHYWKDETKLYPGSDEDMDEWEKEWYETYGYNYHSYTPDLDSSGSAWNYNSDYEDTQCHCCGETCSAEVSYPITQDNGKIVYYCADCLTDKVAWCEKCGKGFEIDPENPNATKCPRCLRLEEALASGVL